MVNALPVPANPAPPPLPDTAGRAINAGVVVLVVLFAAIVLVVLSSPYGLTKLAGALQDKDVRAAVQSIVSAASPLFGSFTTMVGTALAAYFGITATRDVAHNATDVVRSVTQSAAAESGALREHVGQADARNDATCQRLTRVKAILDQTHPGDATHASALDRARALLA